MLHFKRMRKRNQVRTYVCPIAAALRAGPLLGLAATGEDHTAEAMATVGAEDLVDRHTVCGPGLRTNSARQAAFLANSARTNSVPCTKACSLSMAM